MVPFVHKDERLKIVLLVAVIFIIQSICMSLVFISSLRDVNSRFIKQNTAIVNKVSENNEDIVNDIVPIITGKVNLDEEDLSKGTAILSAYSYNKDVSYKDNPFIGNLNNKYIVVIILIALFTVGITIAGILYFINPLFKEIRYLTYRAENILEKKSNDKQRAYKYEGSLDKFVLKFYMMEDRINNSISLLQEEKINLKNIINDISHQLKTPLMALSMYNDILVDDKNMEREDVDNFLNLSSEQLQRMDWLVKTLLKYARLESNVVEYHKENRLLNNTVEESINPLMIKAKEKNQILEFKAEKEIYFNHDRKWISEALSNIIKNAIEHTGENGRIEVGLEETPITIRIWVKDNGEGIDKSEIRKIFNRFHKGQNSINPTSIGIGLCLSKSIVKSHDGDISVESELGRG
ncbi:MAG: sensor histidine kinase, partial [Peptostreptococcaceae bacterium]